MSRTAYPASTAIKKLLRVYTHIDKIINNIIIYDTVLTDETTNQLLRV